MTKKFKLVKPVSNRSDHSIAGGLGISEDRELELDGLIMSVLFDGRYKSRSKEVEAIINYCNNANEVLYTTWELTVRRRTVKAMTQVYRAHKAMKQSGVTGLLNKLLSIVGDTSNKPTMRA